MVHRDTDTQEHVREIAAVMRRAFFDDPFYRYVMPDDRKRGLQLDWWMPCLVRYGCRFGTVHTTPGPIHGVSIWLRPAAPQLKTMALLRAGVYQAPFRVGVRSCLRLKGVSDEWANLHRLEPARHWYLLAIAVDPPHQGRGVGSSLLQPVLEEADWTSMTCYLETMTERNLPFYQMHGFEIVTKGRIKDGGPYWAMRRSPKPE